MAELLYSTLPFAADTTGVAGDTVKLRITGLAALKLALPAWLAVMEQVPAASKVTVLPLTLQIEGVVDASCTVKPEVALAVSTGGVIPSVCVASPLKLMVWLVNGAGETVKLRLTGLAAPKLALPAWLAVMEQVPAASKVTVLPLTLQIEGVVDASCTVKPEVALAVSTGGVIPSVCVASPLKLMVWLVSGAGETVKLLLTGLAALKLALPAWLAVMEQVPAASKVTVLPLTLQIEGVVDASCTVKPEVALAVSTGGVIPSVCVASPLKLMVWLVNGAGETVKLRLTGLAAPKLALPAWLAVMEQVPAASKVKVLPLTLHTEGVVDASCTVKPEVALADKAGGVVPSVCVAGAAKLMVWLVSGAGETVKLRLTGLAAPKLALPAWLAVMEQVPAASKVKVLPLTLHTEGVVDASCTVKPEVALADKAGGVVPSVCVAGAAKLMVWLVNGAGETVKLRLTGLAAPKLALPAWLAVMEQVPAASKVKVLPLTLHTEGVVDASCTVKPEVALADKAGGVVPSVCVAGAAKLMVWLVSGAGETVKLRLTGLAAPKLALPAWLAVMEQVPAASKVKVLPLTLHTEGVVDASCTVKPEVALADKAGGVVPSVCVAGAAKLMVWLVSAGGETVKLRITGLAALKLALPAWLAVMEQVPAASKVKVLPLTLHTEGVVDASCTVKPEVALADKAGGVVPSVCVAGAAKLMVWLVSAAGETVKLRITGLAAPKLALPAWLAVMEQVPAASKVKVLPLTLHTEGVVDASCTVRPEVALADKAGGVVPSVCVAGAAKLMVWLVSAAGETVKLRITGLAALKLALPAWLAVMEQVPAASKVKVLPLTLHTEGVVDASCTVKPEVALADKAGGVVPSVCVAGAAKLMVWLVSAAGETVKLRLTGLAAPKLALPAWLAVMEQVPAASKVKVLPLTLHTEGVVDASCTVKPEVALADKAGGVVPSVCVAGAAKLMVWLVSAAGETVKLRLTGLAAPKLALPAWLAVMEQVPAASKVKVLPLTLHTEGVVDASCTVRPEVALADKAGGVVPSVCVAGAAKLMVWLVSAAGETVKLRITGLAAPKLALPAWLAVMEQVPAASKVKVLPLTLHTEGVVDASCTVKPDVALADKAGGVVPSVCVAGAAKLMVWLVSAAGETVKLRITGLAALKLALPAWLAVMEQVPAASKVKVLPLTLHTEGVVDASCTVKPDVALADKAGGVVPSVCVAGAAKLMVWLVSAAGETVKLWLTGLAAAKLVLPVWLAEIVQMPAASKVSVLPLTVQTEDVVDTNSTGRPDVALADSAGGVLPSVCVAGAVKLMVWLLCLTSGQLRTLMARCWMLLLQLSEFMAVQAASIGGISAGSSGSFCSRFFSISLVWRWVTWTGVPGVPQSSLALVLPKLVCALATNSRATCAAFLFLGSALRMSRKLS